jgi:DNA repair exonuclease SbcCD ATPase subunit
MSEYAAYYDSSYTNEIVQQNSNLKTTSQQLKSQVEQLEKQIEEQNKNQISWREAYTQLDVDYQRLEEKLKYSLMEIEELKKQLKEKNDERLMNERH